MHRICMSASAIAMAALVMTSAACTRASNRWQEPAPTPAGVAPAPAPDAGDDRVVLFAPVALGALADQHPGARLDFAHDMASRMDLLLRDHDGRVAESLPDSDDAAWQSRVPTTAGAHVVVLTRISEIQHLTGHTGASGSPARIRAVVAMRALDVDGKEIWAKKASGMADVGSSPKLMSASAKPESRAAWDACSVGLKSLFAWLEARPDLVATPHRASADVPPGTVVDVVINSQPPNADILIDGELKGTTPRTLPLPARPVTLRLERQGHRVYTRTFTPSAGLEIAPALEPE
ncbi:MAG: PEGA domain-containing protein [Planctomycetes bacterium]|nr:PEGA domain-containing protein [Planctomycetota bacterium]